MAAELLELTNADRSFYPTLGPFLANRQVHKSLGGVPWDDDLKTWYVVKDGRKVLGFCAVATHGARTTVESLYLTDPANRRVASTLVEAVAERHPGELYATVRHGMAFAYDAAGFRRVGETKDFTRLARPVSKEATRVRA